MTIGIEREFIMLLSQFFVALVLALLVVLVFSLMGRRGPWGAIWWFFLVVFLGAWAVGAWAAPVGPLVWNVTWIPFLFGALIFALLMAALPEPPPPRSAPELTAEEGAAEESAATVGLFFWLLIVVFLAAIFFATP